MLRNLPAGLRALGVLVLTGWVGAYLVISTDTPPRGNDITWALLLGIGLVGAGLALASRPVQTRIPSLRPPAYELAGIVRRWQAMKDEIWASPTGEGSLPESLFIKLEQLDTDTEQMIAKHFLDWEPFYRLNTGAFRRSSGRAAILSGIELRHHRLYWYLHDLHGGRNRGVV